MPREKRLRVVGGDQLWAVEDVNGLRDVLAWRDDCGGAELWLSREAAFPALVIRLSGDWATVTYFGKEGHPGFRCLGGNGLPKKESTTFVSRGCDPPTRVVEPNEFVLSSEAACAIACD
jgi:hypothetical protein